MSPSEILNKSQKEKRVKILVDSNDKAKIISRNIKRDKVKRTIKVKTLVALHG